MSTSLSAALVVLAIAVAGLPVGAQERDGEPALDVRWALAVQVAEAWGTAPASVRLEVPADAPALADSVAIEPGSGERWVATFFTGDHLVRRFVRVGLEQQVPVAASVLPRDHIVTDEDLVTGTRVVWGPPAAPSPDPRGWRTHRRIEAGDALVEPSVRPPLLVRGGDDVEAVFTRGGVVLTIRAEALSSARSGEWVRVRMPSGKRMEGRAMGPGRVVLDTGANR